jgi:hypothetical protein
MPDNFDQELEENRKAYEALREKIRGEYAGQYVAMAFGRIIKVCPGFDEACAAIEELQPSPVHYLVFPGDNDPGFEIIENTYREFL